jgi:peptide/nickel transport system substrate-binding protein
MKSATHTEPAYLDAVVFKELPEASVRLGALISGQVQAIDEVPPANFRSVQQDHRLQVVKRENPGVNRALFLNTTRAPFEDVRVRQAFQSAVDVASAVKAAYFGSLNAADKILAPSTLDYDPAVASDWGLDLGKANRLLDDAGWTQRDLAGLRTKDGRRLSVHFVYDSASVAASDVTLAQAIQFSVKKASTTKPFGQNQKGGRTRGPSASLPVRSKFALPPIPAESSSAEGPQRSWDEG